MSVVFNVLCSFILCATIFVVIRSQDAAQDPFGPVTDFYYKKCYNNSRDTKVFDKLYADALDFSKYLEYTFQSLPEKRDTFCKDFRKQLSDRILQISNDLKPCLPAQEKYMAGFIKDSFNGFLHFMCHNDGEYTRTFFSGESKVCRNAIEGDAAGELESCFGKIFTPAKHFVSKKEMCDDVGVARKCFALVLSKKCPNSARFKELNEKFFDYIGEPCAACATYINTVLLAMSVFLSYMFSR